MNEDIEWERNVEDEVVEGLIHVEMLELDKIKRMKHGKAAGPSGVSTEMLKCCEGIVNKGLQTVLYDIMDGKRMSEE